MLVIRGREKNDIAATIVNDSGMSSFAPSHFFS